MDRKYFKVKKIEDKAVKKAVKREEISRKNS